MTSTPTASLWYVSKSHYTAIFIRVMLTYSDKQKFDQIRAHWEAAQPTNASSSTAKMAIRKTRQAAHQQPADEPQIPPVPSKFRRTISQGLSFLTHPLAQRKTPAHQAPRQPLLQSQTASDLRSLAKLSIISDRNISTSDGSSKYTADYNNSPVKREVARIAAMGNDENITPKTFAIPRSQTMSQIPQPTRSRSTAHFQCKPRSPVFANNPRARPSPVFTPTPSPTDTIIRAPAHEGGQRASVLTANSRTSVTPTAIPAPTNMPITQRRHSPLHTVQQSKYIGASRAFASQRNIRPSQRPTRSQTTPNLVKHSSSQSVGTPSRTRYPAKSSISKSPTAQAAAAKENFARALPVTKNISQRQDNATKRYGVVGNRNATEGHNSQTTLPGPSFANPTGTQHMGGKVFPRNGQLAQTPLIANRARSNATSITQLSSGDAFAISGARGIEENRLLAPRNAPTPRLNSHAAAPNSVPRSESYKDFRALKRAEHVPAFVDVFDPCPKTRSSELVEVKGKNEVRIQPCAATPEPHRHQNIPPIPPIPKKYWGYTWTPESPMSLEDDDGTAKAASRVEDDSELPGLPCDNKTLAAYLHKHLADNLSSQITTYMPPAWWAGRFTAKLDIWKTSAARAEVDPTFRPQGPLCDIPLSQEKVAANFIFFQFREMCATNEAADSLWVCISLTLLLKS